MNNRVLLILGAGPGIGLSVARRFAKEGFTPILAGANAEAMSPLVDDLASDGHAADGVGVDLRDPGDIIRVVSEVGERHHRIDVLHFNPSAWRQQDPLSLTAPALLKDLMLGTVSLLPAVQAAVPYFVPEARVLVTGSAAADTPWHEAASLGVQKAAIRNLVTSLDVALAPKAARAVAVQINGALRSEGSFSPAPIAEAMWAAISRAPEHWTPHIAYDG